jgi:hypothetical protein
MTGASGQSRTDDRRFTKSGRGFDHIGHFLASQFPPDFTWLGYQPPGQFQGNYSEKWREIQSNFGLSFLPIHSHNGALLQAHATVFTDAAALSFGVECVNVRFTGQFPILSLAESL